MTSQLFIDSSPSSFLLFLRIAASEIRAIIKREVVAVREQLLDPKTPPERQDVRRVRGTVVSMLCNESRQLGDINDVVGLFEGTCSMVKARKMV